MSLKDKVLEQAIRTVDVSKLVSSLAVCETDEQRKAAFAAMSDIERLALQTAMSQAGIVSKEDRKVVRACGISATGGFWAQDPSFVAYSDKKEKQYHATLNIPQLEVVKQLFGKDKDESLVAYIDEFVDTLTPDNVEQLAKEAQAKKAEREAKAKAKKSK